MNKINLASKIIQHPDLEEIVAKLLLNLQAKDIHEWLAAKYPNEKKFIISEKSIKIFQTDYLDIYTMIRNDIGKTKNAMKQNSIEELELSVKGSSAYKNTMVDIATKELDVRQVVIRLCTALEVGFARLFDSMYDNPDIDLRAQRALNETADSLGHLLETYYKFTENPADIVVQHNVTVQAVDQHIAVFHEAVRETLATLSVESSLLFTELLNQKLSKLKAPAPEGFMNTDMKVAEATLLNETINKKLNDIN